MVFKKNNKRGQAAIEFLMTYGWMLLVVLIVGALIFSFVDFGSLLPSKLELSNNLLADVGGSTAMVDASSSTNNIIIVAFKYSGTESVKIYPEDGTITYNLGGTVCNSTNITNSATGTTSETQTTGVQFRNGHDGYMTFRDCKAFNEIDVVEGDINVQVESAKRLIKTPSSGIIRLNIVDVKDTIIDSYGS